MLLNPSCNSKTEYDGFDGVLGRERCQRHTSQHGWEERVQHPLPRQQWGVGEQLLGDRAGGAHRPQLLHGVLLRASITKTIMEWVVRNVLHKLEKNGSRRAVATRVRHATLPHMHTK